MADEKNSATLQVSGLAHSVTDSLVLNMFRTYGPILRVKVDGYGGAYVAIAIAAITCVHVVFERKTNAYKAVPATNGAVLEGKPISVTMVPKFGNSKKTCRGFVAGICKKGAACKYLHITDNGEGAASQPTSIPKVKTSAAAPAPDALINAAIPAELQNIPINLVCRHFARSGCSLGASCKFAHIRGVKRPSTRTPAPQVPEQMETSGAVAQQASVAPVAPVSKKRAAPAPAVTSVAAKRPCSYFASGLCKRGEQCAYSHDLPTPVAQAPAKKEKKTKAATAPVVTKAPAPAAVAAPATTQHEENSSRICIECETPGIAVWQCAKCDDSLYCNSCNTLVHKSKVMKSHERTKLAPLAPKVEIKNPTCDECEEEESSVKCEQCDVMLCADCDASVHKFKSLRSHTRNAIVKLTATAATSKSTPVAVVAKPAAAVVVQEPAVKKQKVSKTKAVASPVAVPAATAAIPEIEYIESVPKYDLTSASESESSESEEEDQQEDEDETMDSDDDDESPIIATAFPPQSVTNVAPKQQQQKVAPVTAQAPPAPPQTQNEDLSSESSDDDDERPVVLAAPVRKAPVQPVAAVATAANPHEVPSESESSSDDEDAKPIQRSAPVAAPKPAAAPVGESSSSSEEEASSSDDEEVAKPVVKAPVVKKVPVVPAARAPPAPKANSNRENATPGISTGSSHSLVKKIEVYAESGETETLHLDANLNGFERLLAHDCAERLGLKHVSVGEGLERHITICRR